MVLTQFWINLNFLTEIAQGCSQFRRRFHISRSCSDTDWQQTDPVHWSAKLYRFLLHKPGLQPASLRARKTNTPFYHDFFALVTLPIHENHSKFFECEILLLKQSNCIFNVFSSFFVCCIMCDVIVCMSINHSKWSIFAYYTVKKAHKHSDSTGNIFTSNET